MWGQVKLFRAMKGCWCREGFAKPAAMFYKIPLNRG